MTSEVAQASPVSSIRFECEAGLLLRKAVRQWFERLAFQLNLRISIQEQRDWFSSIFLVEVIGDELGLQKFSERYREAIDQWARRNK